MSTQDHTDPARLVTLQNPPGQYKHATPIGVEALGVRGEGNDFHHYRIHGFNTEDHRDAERIPYSSANIFFQDKNPKAGWNGLTLESLLAVCAHRLNDMQHGKYPCDENEEALDYIGKALMALHSRTIVQAAANGLVPAPVEHRVTPARELVPEKSEDYASRSVPAVEEATAHMFVSRHAAQYEVHKYSDDVTVITAPLKFGLRINLASMSMNPITIAAGFHDVSDQVPTKVYVDDLLFSITEDGVTETFRFDAANYASYPYLRKDNDPEIVRTLELDTNFAGMAFTNKTLTALGEPSAIFSPMNDYDTVFFCAHVHGSFNLETGILDVQTPDIILERAISGLNGKDVTVEVATNEKYSAVFDTAKAVGYSVSFDREKAKVQKAEKDVPLGPYKTPLVPVLRGESASMFLSPATLFNAVTIESDVDVMTAPLAISKNIDLIGISQTDSLLASGIADVTDSLDDDIRVVALWMKVTNGLDWMDSNYVEEHYPLSKANTNLVVGVKSKSDPSADYLSRSLETQFTGFMLSSTWPEEQLSEHSEPPKLLAILGDITLKFNAKFNAKISVELGTISNTVGTVHLVGATRNGVDLNLGMIPKEVIERFESATISGYRLQASRVNHNRRATQVAVERQEAEKAHFRDALRSGVLEVEDPEPKGRLIPIFSHARRNRFLEDATRRFIKFGLITPKTAPLTIGRRQPFVFLSGYDPHKFQIDKVSPETLYVRFTGGGDLNGAFVQNGIEETVPFAILRTPDNEPFRRASVGEITEDKLVKNGGGGMSQLSTYKHVGFELRHNSLVGGLETNAPSELLKTALQPSQGLRFWTDLSVSVNRRTGDVHVEAMASYENVVLVEFDEEGIPTIIEPDQQPVEQVQQLERIAKSLHVAGFDLAATYVAVV